MIIDAHQSEPVSLKSLFELFPRALLIIDRDGKIAGANAKVFPATGYREAEITGKTIFQIDPHMGIADWKKYWEKLQTVSGFEGKTEFVTPRGAVYAVKTHAKLFSWAGKDRCFLSVENLSQIQALKEKLEKEKSYLQEEVAETHNFNNIISKSPNYQRVLRQVGAVAATDATVLILGETGTGKELLARAIQRSKPCCIDG